MDKFYTAYDIAEMLNISYVNALKFIKYSGIPYIKIGQQYRVNVDLFNEFTQKTISVSTAE